MTDPKPYRGTLVTGSFRLALNDYSRVLQQIDGETYMLAKVLASCRDGTEDHIYEKTNVLLDKLEKERDALVSQFKQEWLTK